MLVDLQPEGFAQGELELVCGTHLMAPRLRDACEKQRGAANPVRELACLGLLIVAADADFVEVVNEPA
jgi:hypothetical protein